MAATTELARLWSGPAPDEEPPGEVAELLVVCDGDATLVLDRARYVLDVVFEQADPRAAAFSHWIEVLPDWFVSRSSFARYERASLVGKWSMGAWLYWFEPQRRQWTWWDARVLSEDEFCVRLVVDELPYLSGSLEWLFRCAGARPSTAHHRRGMYPQRAG